MTVTTGQDSPFLKLLAELQNCIYEDVLIEADSVEVAEYGGLKVDGQCWRPPGLLQSCREIRAAASPIYYGHNTFLVRTDMKRWLCLLSKVDRGMLQRIHMRAIGSTTEIVGISTLRRVYQQLAKEGIALREDVIYNWFWRESSVHWVNIPELEARLLQENGNTAE